MAIGTNIFASLGASADSGSASTASAPSLAAATYGPAATGSAAGAFSPKTGHGGGFWMAVGGVVVLVLIRQSLPR